MDSQFRRKQVEAVQKNHNTWSQQQHLSCYQLWKRCFLNCLLWSKKAGVVIQQQEVDQGFMRHGTKEYLQSTTTPGYFPSGKHLRGNIENIDAHFGHLGQDREY